MARQTGNIWNRPQLNLDSLQKRLDGLDIELREKVGCGRLAGVENIKNV